MRHLRNRWVAGGLVAAWIAAAPAWLLAEAPAKSSPAAQAGTGAGKRYYPAGTPTREIQKVDDLMGDFVVREKGQPLTAAEEAHNRELKRKILHGTFDIQELARLSLDRHWGQRSAAEQSEFVALLTDLLEEKAIFSKEQSAAKSKEGGKYTVVYRGEKFDDAAKSRAFVRTRVIVPSENIQIALNYRLRKNSSEWKVYDIIVDEASLVDNYRYQFDSIIKKHGYADLVRRMQSKLSEVRADRQQ